MKKNETIKEHIIKMTKELMSKNPNVTIKDISEACFINIAAVNYHFGTKQNLFEYVVTNMIDDLKLQINLTLDSLDVSASIEDTLSTMVHLVYSFALENIGLVNHLFLHRDMQETASNIVIATFFGDNPFTQMIMKRIRESTHITDEITISAKYMLLFSSFCIPLFIQILQKDLTNHEKARSLRNEDFKRAYIQELLRIIQ